MTKSEITKTIIFIESLWDSIELNIKLKEKGQLPMHPTEFTRDDVENVLETLRKARYKKYMASVDEEVENSGKETDLSIVPACRNYKEDFSAKHYDPS